MSQTFVNMRKRVKGEPVSGIVFVVNTDIEGRNKVKDLIGAIGCSKIDSDS